MPIVGYGSAYSFWNTNLATVTARWIFRNQSLTNPFLESKTYIKNCFHFTAVFYYIYSAISNIYTAISYIYSAISYIYSAISNIYSAISNIYTAISYINSAISNIYSAMSYIYSAISNIYFAISYIFSVLPLSFNFSTCLHLFSFSKLAVFFFVILYFMLSYWFSCPVLLLRYILLFIPCSAVGTFME